MAQQTIGIGAIANDGTGDTLRVAGDKINDNFTELYAGLVGLLDLKGSTDCSANPNYPAASKGDYYLVSVAGKIGGASGIVVTAGDIYFAIADNAGGTQASVGTSWTVIQGNVAYVPVNQAGDTMTGDLIVPDEAYDATAWNGSLEVPTKNAVRDKIEAIVAGGGSFTAASTTEQLTGTDNAKGSTPDSVAALWEQGADVASAGTTSLGEGGYFNITGTTTITDIDFATDKAGRKAWVKFAGILTLTHNASTLILPTGASITTAAGDTACFVSEGSDVVRCVAYNRASGAALSGGSSGDLEFIGRTTVTASTADIPLSASYDSFYVEFYFTPSTDNIAVNGQVTEDNFSSVKSGASDYAYSQVRVSSGVGNSQVSAATSFPLLTISGQGNAAGEYMSGRMDIFNAKETAPTGFSVHGNYVTTAGAYAYGSTIADYHGTTNAVNGLRLSASSGTLTGFFKVWGRTA